LINPLKLPDSTPPKSQKRINFTTRAFIGLFRGQKTNRYSIPPRASLVQQTKPPVVCLVYLSGGRVIQFQKCIIVLWRGLKFLSHFELIFSFKSKGSFTFFRNLLCVDLLIFFSFIYFPTFQQTVATYAFSVSDLPNLNAFYVAAVRVLGIESFLVNPRRVD
jgi:hypothetical protein